MSGAFDEAVGVTPVDVDGDAQRFTRSLDGDWRALGGVVNGGYLIAVALSALREALPYPDPLVSSTFFLRPARPGPVDIDIDVIAEGGRNATGEARVIQDGEEVVRSVATFTSLTKGDASSAEAEAPNLPDPERCIDPLSEIDLPDAPMTERVEFRYPSVPGWLHGKPSGVPRAEFWIRFTDERPPDTLSLPLFVDGAAPVVLEHGAAGSATLELTCHVRRPPAPGWLAARVFTRHIAGGLHEEDFELWDATGSLVAQARQLAVVLNR